MCGRLFSLFDQVLYITVYVNEEILKDLGRLFRSSHIGIVSFENRILKFSSAGCLRTILPVLKINIKRISFLDSIFKINMELLLITTLPINIWTLINIFIAWNKVLYVYNVLLINAKLLRSILKM